MSDTPILQKPSIIPLPDPETFAGLMELYESNYIKIRNLCGDIKKLDELVVSRVNGDMDLYLSVIERTKYTTTLNLSYQFSSSDTMEPQDYPNLIVKVYFDAKQAEVLHRRVGETSIFTYDHKLGLNNKWRNNRFLFKWLSYCLQQGHKI